MKKWIRLVSLLVLFCLCLSGCGYLDELRSTRGVFAEDGSIVLADGTKYLPLPENKYFSPGYADLTDVYIAQDEEVPLLLIADFGDWCYKSNGGRFLWAYTESEGLYYCREDSYAGILEQMSGGFTLEFYGYPYYDFDSYQDKIYTFTPKQVEAIEYVLANRKPRELSEGEKLDCEYSVELYQYSGDYLFHQKSLIICFADGTFYLIDGELIYQVPNSLYVTFARAVEKANGAYAYAY